MTRALGTPLLLLLGLLAAFITSGKAARTLTTSEKCELLDKAITDFLAKHLDINSLFDQMGVFVRVDAFLLSTYEKSSGFKFVSSARDRHELACKLAGTKNRADVAKVLGRPKWQVDNLYSEWTAASHIAGSTKNLDDISKVTTLLLIWAQNSGYPVMPFKNLNDAEFLRTFNAIHKTMMAKHIHDNVINAPFPLKVTPNRALQKLKTAKSYQELERGLFLEPNSLADFADYVKRNPGIIGRTKEDIQVTMKLLNALDKTGILNYPR